jgi:hypothetical protein
MECEVLIARDGTVEGGCIVWFDSQDSDGEVFSGTACGELRLDLPGMPPPCVMRGSAPPRVKGFLTGVATCGFEGDPVGGAGHLLFTMTQRPPVKGR